MLARTRLLRKPMMVLPQRELQNPATEVGHHCFPAVCPSVICLRSPSWRLTSFISALLLPPLPKRTMTFANARAELEGPLNRIMRHKKRLPLIDKPLSLDLRTIASCVSSANGGTHLPNRWSHLFPFTRTRVLWTVTCAGPALVPNESLVNVLMIYIYICYIDCHYRRRKSWSLRFSGHSRRQNATANHDVVRTTGDPPRSTHRPRDLGPCPKKKP